MFRKSMIALAAIATVSVAALAASPAEARHGHRFYGVGITIGVPLVAASCWQYRYVETRRGWRRVLVNICG